ncbi:hypothetical protein [Vibrio phage BONAISHI]|nr:hypothetical protein [Vibrio phage BONAISHI]
MSVTMTSKRTGKLNHATVSDVHLFHPRVFTVWILRSLSQELIDKQEDKDLDYIWFAGDVFDRIAQLPQSEVLMVHTWIGIFLMHCQKHNIRVRILEGTPSHDRGQSNLFVKINNLLAAPANLRYHDKLCIDYEEEFDFNVLYVPDEWRHDPEITWNEVVDELRTKGLDKVDISVMHGTMDFQVPKFLNIPGVHQSKRYSDITNWFVTIGHQHVMSVSRNIYAQGSLDRLSQNEEQDKGHFRFMIDMDKDVVVPEFRVNRNAMPHRDVNVSDLEFTEAFEKACMVADDILTLDTPLEVRYYGFIRLSMSEAHYANGLLSSLKSQYPQLSWDRKIIADKEKEAENDSMDFALDEAIALSPVNAMEVMTQELSLLPASDAERQLALSLFEEVI